MNLTDTATGVTYCMVVVRSVDTPASMSSCPSSPNDPLSTGVYSVEVYDIESDGGVSSAPALAGEVVTMYGPSNNLYGPSGTYGPSDGEHGSATTKNGLSSDYCKPGL